MKTRLDAAVAQPAHQGEQPMGIGTRQRAGRLVEHEDAHIEQQGTGDLDELLGSRAEVCHRALRPNLRMFQNGQCLTHAPPVVAPTAENRDESAPAPSMTLASTVRCGASVSS